MSARLSVTLRYCIKTKKASVMISSPSASLIILVSGKYLDHYEIRKGSPRAWAISETGVGIYVQAIYSLIINP